MALGSPGIDLSDLSLNANVVGAGAPAAYWETGLDASPVGAVATDPRPWPKDWFGVCSGAWRLCVGGGLNRSGAFAYCPLTCPPLRQPRPPGCRVVVWTRRAQSVEL